MTIVFINPNLLVQRNDPFTTGVVYMPVGLASTVAAVRAKGIAVAVIDAFGAAPRRGRLDGKFMVLGLSAEEIIERMPVELLLVCIYANQLINHLSIVSIIEALKSIRPGLRILILENTQAVTAYALRSVADEFLRLGADYVLTGEAEERLPLVIAVLNQGDKIKSCDGLYGRDFANPASTVIQDLNCLPFPAWDLFPVENYWKLRFAHGPQSAKRYLPLLTSRGCPYPCKFCVIPATNFLKWRARSPASVADEMAYWQKSLGVSEFHIEDLDPTVNDKRTRALCKEIIVRGLKVTWKIVAGTKVETIRNEETINLMSQAGCRYISISPESGSPRMLGLMNKPFKVDHAVRMIQQMNKDGIRSQACFVLGFPGETDNDRLMTRSLIKRLTLDGLDEIAIFIISPVPGSAIFKEFKGYSGLSDLNFTPSWREDYAELNRFRLALYRSFLWWKIRYHPFKILLQCTNFLNRHFETKMEMVPYKAVIWRWTEHFQSKKIIE
jgi:radical SAM superfamily enzyme YgiQ (UPF0313 family)